MAPVNNGNSINPQGMDPVVAFLRDSLDKYHNDMKAEIDDIKRLITSVDQKFVPRTELEAMFQLRDARLTALEQGVSKSSKLPTWASMALGLCASGAITLLSFTLYQIFK